MKLEKIMQELQKKGTLENVEIYKKQGAGDNLFGVSFSNLKILKNKISQDNNLANELWQTANIDARLLATMIAEPDKFKSSHLDEWLSDISYYLLIDLYVSNIVLRTKYAQIKMEEWIESKKGWTNRAGWQLLTHLAMGNYGLPNIYFIPFLKLISSEIHKAPNQARDAINGALIAIGLRNDILEKRALNVAGKTGTVEVNYGETYSKIPSATEYIKRVRRCRRRAGLD